MAKMMRAGWAGLALLAATLSYAADAPAPDSPFSTGKVPDGATKTAVCTGCHGPNGNSTSPDWPRLAGQSAVYIAEQLHDYASGARYSGAKNPAQPSRNGAMMLTIAKRLTPEDIRNVASYVQGLR